MAAFRRSSSDGKQPFTYIILKFTKYFCKNAKSVLKAFYRRGRRREKMARNRHLAIVYKQGDNARCGVLYAVSFNGYGRGLQVASSVEKEGLG